MAVLTPTPKQQIFNSDGTPLVGGKIYTYAAGTSTPIATYTDYSAGTANTNPVILNSLGQANIWLLTSASYKFIVKDASDVLLYTVDNILPPLDNNSFSSPPPIGNVTPSTASFTTLTLTATSASTLNRGTTGQRPGGVNGMIRYNTTTASMEGYINSAWQILGPGSVTSVATGTGLTGGPITSTGTLSIDSTVATLTGTQTLTNKTLTSPTLTTPNINSAPFATVTGTAPLYAARAWINFNGIGTVAINSSGNVSSITDFGTGDYSVNFTIAMPDNLYSVVTAGTATTDSTTTNPYQGPGLLNLATSSFGLVCGSDTSTKVDWLRVCAAVFR
jgi:hypothetical protein